ncbi:MAG TPA: hypothetical protein VF447_17550 [Terriglobales bacterium]
MTAQMPFKWDADAAVMVPLRRTAALRHFVDEQIYTLEEVQERSAASHAHYFASLHEAWLNLPDETAERFANEEHFRKFCLIKCGYCDQRQVVCSTKAEGERIAAFVRSMSPYTVVSLKDRVVTAYEAKSQSHRSMSKEEFQASKTAVLDYAASLIGAERNALEQNAGASA